MRSLVIAAIIASLAVPALAQEGDTKAEAAWGLERETKMAEVLADAADELKRVLSAIAEQMLARSSHEDSPEQT